MYSNNLSPLTGSRVAFSAQSYASDDAATAFQFLATVLVSIALVVVVCAAFASPPRTSTLGLALGVMLGVFSLLQMIAFSFMAALVTERESSSSCLASAIHICWRLVLAGIALDVGERVYKPPLWNVGTPRW